MARQASKRRLRHGRTKLYHFETVRPGAGSGAAAENNALSERRQGSGGSAGCAEGGKTDSRSAGAVAVL